MTITAIVIPAEVDEPIRLEQIDRDDLDSYRRIIGGPLAFQNLDREPAVMYSGDSSEEVFPFNRRATVMLWAHNSQYRGQEVSGSAIVVGPPDRKGRDKSVSDDLVNLLFHTESYGVQVRYSGSAVWHESKERFTSWHEAYLFAGVQIFTLAESAQVFPRLDVQLRETWYRIGLDNEWIRRAYDPPFTRDSFTVCYGVQELQEAIQEAVWGPGTAFYYRDLCFIEQTHGCDEWLTIRHGIAFESMNLLPIIQAGKFPKLIRRLLTATKEQCETLTY